MSPLRAFKVFSPNPELLEQFAYLSKDTVEEASVLLELLLTNTRNVVELVRRAKEIEHAADEIVHGIFRTLTRTYMSEFDRGDLHKLASSLDDIIDFAYGAADRVVLYKISEIPPGAGELAAIIHRQTAELAAALSALQKREQVFQHCSKVKQLEVDADQITNAAVADLFEREMNAIQLIKIKELLTQLAFATDRAKDAAEVIETMVLKRGAA